MLTMTNVVIESRSWLLRESTSSRRDQLRRSSNEFRIRDRHDGFTDSK